jgi:putative membrane protein
MATIPNRLLGFWSSLRGCRSCRPPSESCPYGFHSAHARSFAPWNACSTPYSTTAPMTLVLRILNVTLARRLSRVLKSWPVRILCDPIVASFLNVGGLRILYTTDLYAAMQQNILLHVLIHKHVFIAGYLFTVSMIYIDPTPHRSSFVYRAIVLVIALAGHSILSKYIHAQPPNSVPAAQAEIGGMLMYYGGDAIDVIIIFILCVQWYRATRPRASLAMAQHSKITN